MDITTTRAGSLLAAIKSSTLEDKLKRWAKGPGADHDRRCENAVNMVRDAISKSPELDQYRVQVFVKGSHRHKTNISTNSDIDIAVMADSVFYSEYPAGMTKDEFDHSSSTLTFEDFKSKVVQALKDKFGWEYVTVGDKSIKIKSNTYHLHADVVPCFKYLLYVDRWTCLTGTRLRSDSGVMITNWPQQDYDNGVTKNTNTSRRYKRIVRILKNLRNEMKQEGKFTQDVPSYLLECLAWNVSDACYLCTSLKENLESVLLRIWSETKDGKTPAWKEVNNIKPLFGPEQKWSARLANSFALAALSHLELI